MTHAAPGRTSPPPRRKQHGGGGQIADRIGCADAVQRARQNARHRECAGDADDQTDADTREPVAPACPQDGRLVPRRAPSGCRSRACAASPSRQSRRRARRPRGAARAPRTAEQYRACARREQLRPSDVCHRLVLEEYELRLGGRACARRSAAASASASPGRRARTVTDGRGMLRGREVDESAAAPRRPCEPCGPRRRRRLCATRRGFAPARLPPPRRSRRAELASRHSA